MFPVGGAGGITVRHRVEEVLGCDFGAVEVPGAQRDGGREVPARARPRDGDALWVAAERVGGLDGPLQRRVRVVKRLGERVFGREPVVHADDDTAGARRDFAADAADGIERAERPAAAVVEDDDGRGPVGVVVVDANRNVAVRPGEREVADERHVAALVGREHVVLDAARVRDRELVPLRDADGLDVLDGRGEFRVECGHG